MRSTGWKRRSEGRTGELATVAGGQRSWADGYHSRGGPPPVPALADWQVKRDQYYIERPSIDTEAEDFACALVAGFFWPLTVLVFAVIGVCKGLRKVVTAGVPSIKEMNQR